MTHRRFLMAVVFIGFTAFPSVAQMPRPLPSLHVEGRNMVDRHGNKVLLHEIGRASCRERVCLYV